MYYGWFDDQVGVKLGSAQMPKKPLGYSEYSTEKVKKKSTLAFFFTQRTFPGRLKPIFIEGS